MIDNLDKSDKDARGFVISATTSRGGKTTIASSLMRAFSNTGLDVQGAKVGPDYIDPQFHLLATGKPSYNLDPFLSGGAVGVKRTSRRLLSSDILVVEGVMGLFDGTYLPPPSELQDRSLDSLNYGSTAHVAAITGLPIVLIVDATSTSMSLAAAIEGFASHSDLIDIKGVIVNKVGSKNHGMIIERALSHLPIKLLGLVPRSEDIALPSRYLGLIQPTEFIERSSEILEQTSGLIASYIDMSSLKGLAAPIRKVPPTHTTDELRFLSNSKSPLVSVAQGAGFTFSYQENLDILHEQGAQVKFFDPNHESFDTRSTHLILGGGYPELHIGQITKNKTLLRQIKEFAMDGGTIWAECGGHMLLGKAIEEIDAVGLLPHTSHMSTSLHLGYRRVTAKTPNPLFDCAQVIPAHEYHYSTTKDDATDLFYEGFNLVGSTGVSSPTLLSSYMHFHLGGLIGQP